MAANDASGPHREGNISKKRRLLTGTSTASGGRPASSLNREGSAEKCSNMDALGHNTPIIDAIERDFKEILKEIYARLVASLDARKKAEDILSGELEARQKEREGFLELISFLEKELGEVLEEKVALKQSEQSLREALQSQEKELVDLRSSMRTIQKGAGQAYSSFNRLHGKLGELRVVTNLCEEPAGQDYISPGLDPDFVDGDDDGDDHLPISAHLRSRNKA